MEKSDTSGAISQLQEWYVSNCDGDWEHSYGFSLGTLDNPGWSVTVDLDETALENQPFSEQRLNCDHPFQWLNIKKDGTKLHGACGPAELGKMLSIISAWLCSR